MKHCRTIATVITLAALGTITSCSNDDGPNGGSGSHSKTPSKTAAPKTILNVTNSSFNSDLYSHPIILKATGGEIKDLQVVGNDAQNIKIDKSNKSTWTVRGMLNPNENYTLKYSGVNGDNVITQETKTIKTVANGVLTGPTIFPYGNMTVGVGMPITVNFKHTVKNKVNVENNIRMNMSKKVAGSWGWLDDKTLVYRPDSYWPTGEKINYTINVKGLELGYGYTGKNNLSGSFTVGRKLEMKISNPAKTLQVLENDKVIRTIPVSLGKPGHRTSSGLNIIYEKQSPVRMRGEDYDEIVYYAQRYTTMGEYIHSAPWSVGSQGYTNVSHGCVNIAPMHATWLWKKTLVGDIVNITGTGKKAQTWDGMGAIWNYSPTQWHSFSSINELKETPTATNTTTPATSTTNPTTK